jgi:hypothetical protein
VKNEKLILALAVVGFLALYTLIVFSFFSTEGETRVTLLLLFALPLIGILIAFPRAAFLSLCVVIYFVRTLYDYWQVIPREVTWLVDLLIGLLVLRTLVIFPMRKYKTFTIEKYIYGLIAFGVISALINGVGTTSMVAGMRLVYRYVLLFAAAYHLDISENWLKGYLKFLFVVAILQTPVVLYQFNLIGWADPDAINGTFGKIGQTAGLGLFMLFLISYMVARMLETGRFQVGYLFLIAWMSVGPLLGEIKFYFFFIPILLVFLIRADLRRPLLAGGLLTIAAVILIGVQFIVAETGGWVAGYTPLKTLQMLTTGRSEEIAFQMEVFEREGRSDRVSWYFFGVPLAFSTATNFAFGTGPGIVTEFQFTEHHSQKYEEYARYGLISSKCSSAMYIMTEYGVVGFILFGVLLWMIYRRGRFLRASDNMEMRVYGRTLEAMVMLYGTWAFYQQVWQTDATGCAFFPLCGMLVYFSRREELKQQRSVEPAPAT